MPRKTPQELQDAKRQRAIERQQEADRQRLEDEREAAEELEQKTQAREQMIKERELYDRLEALSSYVDGIYDEVSKISSKRPTDAVSERTLERANRAIVSAHELLADEKDPYLDEIQKFVPAGDDVEARDVVLTLRQVKDALARMRKRHSSQWRHFVLYG